MRVDGLVVPDLLVAMLDQSRWPRDADEASRSFVSEDRNRRLRRICLYPPPFRTLARGLITRGDSFYAKFGALHELAPRCRDPDRRLRNRSRLPDPLGLSGRAR
jgi:hypothetical protein